MIRRRRVAICTVKSCTLAADHADVTSGDFDFFGAPTSPPPGAPPAPGAAVPAVNQFGMPVAPPAVNQFGMPVAPTQFGMPAGAPAPVLRPPVKDQTARNLAVIGGLLAGVAALTGGLIYLQHLGNKTAGNVATTVETPVVKAHQIVETSDLQQAEQAEETYLAQNSGYAASTSLLPGFTSSATDKITVVSATATTFCLRADDLSSFHAPSLYLSSAANAASTTPCT
ncbi:hypothetical protein acdb102_13070 [Acidothermaceae bacterium B102]|nr:hypothetical protein acdb102_13070 [Acidothermaceae bacterium B102]